MHVLEGHKRFSASNFEFWNKMAAKWHAVLYEHCVLLMLNFYRQKNLFNDSTLSY